MNEFENLTVSGEKFLIGDWEISPNECTVRSHIGDQPAKKITPRAMEVMVHLARYSGQVISADALLDEIWNGSYTTSNAVQKCVAELRHALDDDPKKPRIIQTIHKRGYKLLLAPTLQTSRHRQVVANPLVHATSNTGPRSRLAVAVTGLTVAAAFLLLVVVLDFRDSQADHSILTLGHEKILLAKQSAASASKSSLLDLVYRHATTRLSELPGATLGSGSEYKSIPDVAQMLRDIDAQRVVTFGELNGEIIVTIAPGASSSDHIDTYLSHDGEPLSDFKDRIARVLAADLDVLIDHVHLQRMRNWGTRSVHAYRLAYEAAVAGQHLNRQDLRKAERLLQAAIQEDPKFVEAYGMLGDCLDTLGKLAQSTREREATRQRLIEILDAARTQSLGTALIEALQRRLVVLSASNPITLEREFSQAIQKNSEDAEALYEYGYLLNGSGLLKESQAFYAAASSNANDAETARLYELTSSIDLAGASNQLEEAIELGEEYVRSHPYTISLYGLVVKNAALRNFHQARHYLERLLQTDPDGRYAYAAQVELAVQTGTLQPGTAELQTALSDPKMSNLAKGRIYFVLGMLDEGVKAWRNIEPGLLHLVWQFGYQWRHFYAEGVWEDPRYQFLLEDFGIGARWRRYLLDRVSELSEVTGIEAMTVVDGPAEPRLIARYGGRRMKAGEAASIM